MRVWASSTATRPKPTTCSCCGKRSSATSTTARRSSSTNSSPPVPRSGAKIRASRCCCRTGMKARVRNTRARVSNVSSRSRPKATFASRTARPPRSTSTCCARKRMSADAYPLVVMTPKSLLRNRAAYGKLDELVDGSFRPVIDDPRMTAGGDRNARSNVCCCARARSTTTWRRARCTASSRRPRSRASSCSHRCPSMRSWN